MNLDGIKAVGGFFRYGPGLYPMGEHDLQQFSTAMLCQPILNIIATVEKMVSRLSGGHTLKCEEVVIQNGLMVFGDINYSWQVAFATDEKRYLDWLKETAGFTHAQYTAANKS